MEKHILFEQAFVIILAEMAVKREFTNAEFGRLLFDDEHGARTWRKVRDKSKPRRLTIAESYKAAEILGKDYPTMIWEIEKEAASRGLLGPIEPEAK